MTSIATLDAARLDPSIRSGRRPLVRASRPDPGGTRGEAGVSAFSAHSPGRSAVGCSARGAAVWLPVAWHHWRGRDRLAKIRATMPCTPRMVCRVAARGRWPARGAGRDGADRDTSGRLVRIRATIPCTPRMALSGRANWDQMAGSWGAGHDCERGRSGRPVRTDPRNDAMHPEDGPQWQGQPGSDGRLVGGRP
jgi:hypothetical protein